MYPWHFKNDLGSGWKNGSLVKKKKCLLLFQKTQVQFPGPKLGGTKPPVTSALGDQKLTCVHTQANNTFKKCSLSIFLLPSFLPFTYFPGMC